MSKTKRIASICMAAALSAAMVTSVTACSTPEELVKDGKTVNVKVYSAGYGTRYIYEMEKKFEAAYAEEGYKLNIFTPQAGFNGEKFLQDIATGAGADLYIGSQVTEDLLQQYPNSVYDITDSVANKKPIGFNGEEVGDKTIAQILDENTYGYTALQKSDGTYYAMPWTAGMRGLLVNTKVLGDYNLETPKTSKEFFDCYETIMATADDTGVFPITNFAGETEYPMSFVNCWLAQYQGYDWYQQLFSFENSDGSAMTKTQVLDLIDGADGLEIMLENMFHALDPNCATFGSQTQNVEAAQAKLMMNKCAFMMNGDWFISETYSNYEDAQRANIEFLPVPVISELGVKVFGAGTAYNKSETVCETILRAIVDEVDLNKSVAEIKAVIDQEFTMDVATSDIQVIAEARGYTNIENAESGMYINQGSEVKDIASLFVRMCCSQEGGKLIAENTYSSNPFAMEYETSRYKSVNQARALLTNQYFQGIRHNVTGHRKQMANSALDNAGFINFFPSTGIYFNLRITEKNVSIYNEETLEKIGTTAAYKSAAGELATTIYNDLRDNAKYVW